MQLSELIASHFVAHGIPAVSAIEKSNKYLYIVNEAGFLVYPWVNAKALDKDAINIPQALEVARILSKIHAIDLKLDDINAAEFDIHDNHKLITLAHLANEQHLSFAQALTENLEIILEINNHYHRAISILKNHTVISHGDLDQKNILWDKLMNPILIDWESARKLNPTYEIVNAALDWSGITTKLDKHLFGQMIKAYKEAGGALDDNLLEAAFLGVLGNWINWMVYNIQRASNQQDQEQHTIGSEQVEQVLPTILRLKNLIPELLMKIKL